MSSPITKFRFQEQGLSTISEKPKGSPHNAKGHEKLKKRRSKLSVTVPADSPDTKLAASDSEALESPDKDPLSQTWHFVKSEQRPRTSSPVSQQVFKMPAHKTVSDPFGRSHVPHQIPQIPPKVSEDVYKNSTLRRSSSNPELSILDTCKPEGEVPKLKSKKSLKHRISKKLKHFRKDHDKQSPEVMVSPHQPEQSATCSPATTDTEEVTCAENNNIKFEFEQSDSSAVVEEGVEATESLMETGEESEPDPRGSSDKIDPADAPKGFLRRVSSKMSVKLKSLSTKNELEEEGQGGEGGRSKSKHKRPKDPFKVEVVDLSEDSVKEVPHVRLVSLTQIMHGKFNGTS